MAPRGKTATKATATDNGQRDFTVYAEKDISPTMEAFADWLIEVTGIELANQRAEDNFRKGVQLGGTLRMQFQQSDEWAEDDRNPRNKEDKPAKPAPAKRGRKPAAKAEPEPEPDEDEIVDEEEEAPKPARRTGRRPAAAKSTAKAPARRGRPRKAAKPADDEDVEAPY